MLKLNHRADFHRGGGAKLRLKRLSLGHCGKLFVSGQTYRHVFEGLKKLNNAGFLCGASGKCHPELGSGSCQPYIIPTKENINNISSAFRTAKRHIKGDFVPQKESETGWLPKQLCHPELGSGSCQRYIIPNKKKINNISFASNSAKRHVKGDLVTRRVAFTLAEVLITLGIIGVVAAMTLPTLITSYKEKQRVTQLKKSYSVLQQAFLRAVEKHGDAQYWDLTRTDTGETDENGDPIMDYSGVYKILGYFGENLNTQKPTDNLTYKYLSLDGRWLYGKIFSIPPERYLYLNDNSILVPGWVNNNSPYAGYENNTDFMILFPECTKRGECKVGVDIFYFKLFYNKGFVPTGALSMVPKYSEPFEQACNRKSTSQYNGRACTAWVIYNENMDYLHCDDLSWGGKHKCK